jgi:YidC/Oxa1 family membrane protein insertase
MLGIPLGFLMFLCFSIVRDYGGAIILFAVIGKIIFFPLSISAQKNAIRLRKLQFSVEDIRLRYDDKNRINEEIYNLYKREGYSPLKGSIPLLVQLPMILGMIDVMYNPLKHVLHLDKDVIASLSAKLADVAGTSANVPGEQLRIIAAVRDPANAAILGDSAPGVMRALDAVRGVDLHFLGIDLGATPSILSPSMLLIVPILSGISALILCIVQNALNPAAQMQGALGKNITTAVLVAFSLYFTLVVPCGVGVYWICSNILALLVALILNVLYNPGAEADVAGKTQKQKLSRAERQKARELADVMKEKEKADCERFFDTQNKQLVFYAATKGSYKYFQRIIEYLLAHSDIVIHYVSSDPGDPIFERDEAQFKTYYAGERRIISLMVKMDADIVVMTTPDLQKYHIKRSVVRKDIEYIYVFHAISSNMVYREGAFNHYDTIFCEGPHKVEEIRKEEQAYGLPAKRLVKVGYGLTDMLIEHYAEMPKVERLKPQIVIAPSWQIDNILDSCIDKIIEQLVGTDFDIIVRPHPEYAKRFSDRLKNIVDRHAHLIGNGLTFEIDNVSNETIYQSDLLISDWSSVAFEFSFCTKSPTVFINTTMKVMNPEYKRIGITPINIALRDIVGVSVNIDRLDKLHEIVETVLANKAEYQDKINAVMPDYVYYPGRSGEAGGKYIMSRLANRTVLEERGMI